MAPVAPRSGGSTPRAAFALLADVVPVGSLHTSLGGAALDVDTSTAYGVSAGAELFVSRVLAVGVVPRFIWGLHGPGAMNSATQLDMLVRASAGTPAGDGLSVQVYGNVGMSWIFAPDDTRSSGLTFGFGAAASYAIGDANFVRLDISYQLGRQGASVGGVDVDASSSLLHVGLGLGTYL